MVQAILHIHYIYCSLFNSQRCIVYAFNCSTFPYRQYTKEKSVNKNKNSCTEYLFQSITKTWHINVYENIRSLALHTLLRHFDETSTEEYMLIFLFNPLIFMNLLAINSFKKINWLLIQFAFSENGHLLFRKHHNELFCNKL